MAGFTQEQIRKLETNKYVASVTDSSIQFTEEFKWLALEDRKNGKSQRAIFRDYGIDPKMLGEKRIENFFYWLRRRTREEDSCGDERKANESSSQRPEVQLDVEEQLKKLQHELSYARQEIEFLKKIQLANTEARKQWELKQRQK